MATQAKSEQTITNQILDRVDDFGRRLGGVEIDLAIIKSNYATKEDLARLYQAMTGIDGSLDAKMAQMETRLIKWFIGTALTMVTISTSLAFLVARFIH
jgi:hypothetical protein